MSCKYKYKDNWYSKDEIKKILLKERGINSKGELIKPTITNNPKQAKITRENTTSIESVKNKIANDLGNGNFKAIKDQGFWRIVQILDNGAEVGISKEEDYYEPFIFDTKEQAENYINKGKGKEYTSQALTNLKIAALKEVARKYPRSLITSKVVPINPNMVDNSEIQYSKKQGYNPKTITDEYGNTWNEISLDKIKTLSELTGEKTILPSNGDIIKNDIKTESKKVNNFVYKSNPEINPYKFDESKGGYADVVSRLKSRLITLNVVDNDMNIKDLSLFNRLSESWTNQAEKLYELSGIPNVMTESEGKVQFRNYIFNEIDFENGVITEENKVVEDKVRLKEAGLTNRQITQYENEYFNKPHTYEDGSTSTPLEERFNVSSYIDFINKRNRTNLDQDSFDTIATYVDELNRIALEPDPITIQSMTDEETEALNKNCKI